MGRPTLGEFLASHARNAWLKHPALEVYVRSSARYLGEPPDKVLMFDIANVTAKKPGNGAFTRFLGFLHTTLPLWDYDGIYVEILSSPRFIRYLEKQGFRLHTEDPGLQSVCMYKLFEE